MDVVMIPARGGSKRIPKKNTKLLNGKSLVGYAIDKALTVVESEKVFVNTDDDEIEKIAFEYGVNCYRRPQNLGEDWCQNDHFAYDFFKKVDCDNMLQILPTSPLLMNSTVMSFYKEFKKSKAETLVSVYPVQIECLYKEKPVNFDILSTTLPSQELTPILAYACSLMAWEKTRFIENFEKETGAYHGGLGNTKLYPILPGIETIDIDVQSQWDLVEFIMKSQNKS